MKKLSLLVILCMVISIFSICVSAVDETEPLLFTKTQDGLQLVAEIDKTVLEENEYTAVTFYCENIGDASLYQYESLGASWFLEGYVTPKNEPNKVVDSVDVVVEDVNWNAELEPGKKSRIIKGNISRNLKAGEYTFVVSTVYGLDVPPEESWQEYDEKTAKLSVDFTVIEKTQYCSSYRRVSLNVEFEKKVFSESEKMRVKVYAENIGQDTIYQHRIITNSAWDFWAKITPLNSGANASYYTPVDKENIFDGSSTSVNTLNPGEKTPVATFELDEFLEDKGYNFHVDFEYAIDGEHNGAAALDKNVYTLSVNALFTVSDSVSADLSVSAVACSQSEIVEGEEATLTATVRNLADQSFGGDVSVDFYCDGVLLTTVTENVYIEANKFATVTSDISKKFAFGAHKIYAVVRCDRHHEDIGTDDNLIKNRITVE